MADQALIDQRQRHDFRRLREGARGRRLVAERDVEGDIAAVLRPNPRRVRLQRRGDADDMRPRLPIDRDRLGGVLGAIERIGDHKGNRIADVAHLVARQDRIGRHVDRGVRKRHSARQRPEIGGVGAGEHEPHARHRPRFRRIDAKRCMGVRRAQHYRMQRAARRGIGDVAAAPAQQRVVLLAHDRLADAELQRLHAIAPHLMRNDALACIRTNSRRGRARAAMGHKPTARVNCQFAPARRLKLSRGHRSGAAALREGRKHANIKFA